MSSDLSWKEHYVYLSPKAYKTLRRTFSSVRYTQAKKVLYLSLVRSQLTYCSPVWRPQLIKDITAIENIQRRATKFILSDYSSDYKTCLTTLHILLVPLMMQPELNDILFFITCLNFEEPTRSFNILNYVTFSSSSTRLSSHVKLKHFISRNSIRHSFFKRLPRLWNYLPTMNLSWFITIIKHKLSQFFGNRFTVHFNPDNIPVHSYHHLCPCSRCAFSPISYNLNSVL